MYTLRMGAVCALAAGLGCLPATANDLAPYSGGPSETPAIYDWSGFYAGANGGWGSSRNCWDFTTRAGVVIADEGCHDASGGTVGGQIGYRWQASDWVFGVEAQGNWANLDGRNVSDAFPAFTNRSRLDAIGLFTGQIGYARDAALFYLKGGAAVTSTRYQGLVTATGIPAANPANSTAWGGMVGVGFEYGFAPNWSLGLEYDRIFMGSSTHTFTNNGTVGAPGTLFGTNAINQDVDVLGIRLNFRFD